MTRKLLRGWGATALVVPLTVLAGCGDITDIDFGAPATDEQAAAPTPNPTLASAVINEGQAASLSFGTVCVDDNTAVTLTVDFNDPNDAPGTPNASRTITAPGGGFAVTAACAPRKTACDAGLGAGNPAECAPFTHVYPDDVPGTVAVQTTVVQSAQQTLNTVNLTVNNVTPVVDLVRNLAQGDLEGRQQIFTASVVDPGTLATEIKSVQWTFTDAVNVADPTTISCVCQPTIACVDQDNAPLPAVEPLCAKAASTRTTTFLQGRTAPTSYVTTVIVTDESDASANDVDTLSVRNDAPQAATISATTTTVGTTRPLTAATLSLDAGAPTEVAEGTRYTFTGDYTEAGTDLLTIAWDLDTGRAGGTSTATQQITKASFPNRVGLTPADGLRPTFIHTVDSLTPVVHQLRVTDNDNAASLTERFVRVIDVNPRVTLTSSAVTVAEGGEVTFTATAVSGALDDASADPINLAGNAWTFDGVAAASITNVLTIVSGCTANTLSCVVRFLDNDPVGRDAAWDIGFTASDEDSSTTASPVVVTVNNVVPTIVAMTINASATSATINEGAAANVVVTGFDPALALDGSYTVEVDFGDGAATATGTLVALAGSAPGTAFATISRTFVDNDKCANPGSTDDVGVCTVTARICEAAPPGPPVPALCSLVSQMTLVVNNVVPTVLALAPATLVEGSTAALNGDFTDPAAANDNAYRFQWSWTDGATANVKPAVAGTATFATRSADVDITSNPIVNVGAAGADVTFKLTVTDKDGGSASQSASVTRVRDAVPNVILGAVTLSNAGNELATPSVEITATTETLADPLSSITVDWGEGALQVFTGVAGIPAANQFSNTGLSVTFTATKPAPYSDSDSNRANIATTAWPITVTVLDEESTPNAAITGRNPIATTQAVVVNVAPTIVTLVPTDNPVIVSEGQAAAFIVTTTDVSPADRPELVLSVNWGDGSGIEPFVQSSAAGNDQVFRAAHIYNSPGTKTASFIVRDREGGASVATTRTIEVVNLAPSITDLVTTGPVPEGTPVTVAALTDNRGADVLKFSFDFNCASLGTANFGAAPGLLASAVSNFTYTTDGTKTVCVRVCDDDAQPNSCATATTTISIVNAVPVITSITAPTTVNEGGTVALTATATDLDALVFSFDCGAGGAAQIGTTTGTGANKSSTTTCSYPSSGRFTASVSVADDGPVASTRTTTVNVINLAPTAPTLVSSSPDDEGSESTFTATAVAGIGGSTSRFEFDLDNNGIVDAVSDAVAGVGVARFTFATDGAKTVKARACDIEGACSAFATTVVAITNIAPVITLVSAPATVRIGSPVTVSVEASDVGRDVLTYKFEFLAGATVLQTVTTGAPLATVTINQVGTITARVTVTDTATTGPGLTDVESKTFAVTTDGSRVSFSSSATSINEGGSVTLTASTVPEAAGLFDFAIKCSATATAVVSNDDADGVVTQSCTYRNNGSFLASVRATDANGVVEERSLLIVVENVAPTTPVASVTTAAPLNEGSAVAFTATSSDVGLDDVLRFEYDFDNNGGFEVSSTTAAQSFTFPRDGVFVVKVRACDNDNACSAAASVNVTIVNVAPVIALNGIAVQSSVAVGSPLTASVTASDVGNDPLTYTFTFTTGTSVIVVGPQANPVATITPLVSGASTVSVVVSDGTLSSAPQVATYTVENEAPRIASFTTTGNLSTVDEGASLVFTATATDRGGGALTFQIDCTGNGPSADDPVAGATGTCAYAKSGTVAASVTVTDVGGLTDTRTSTILVRNVAPAALVATATAAVINEGTAATITATATDAGGDAIRFEFDFDNNGSFEASSTSGSASFRFPEDGVKSIKVRACDDENACSAAVAVAVTVNNVLPVIASIDVASSSLVGAAVTVSVVASDVGGDVLGYAVEFTSPETGTVRVPAAGFSPSPIASATLREAGTYSVKAIVRDTVAGVANTVVVEQSVLLTVTDISVNVTANAFPAVINEGDTTKISVFPRGTGPYRVSYDINADGDFDDAVDVVGQRCAGDEVDPCQLTGVSYAQNRVTDLSFRVLVQVIDEGQNNLLSTAVVAIEVRNVAPVLTAIVDATIDEDAPFAATAVATDVGVEDDLVFAVVSGPAGVTINAETGAISWQPSFRDLGANRIEISVTDSDNAVTTTFFTVTVLIVDDNGNGISDGEERSLNDGELFCVDTAACAALADLDSDNDGISDLDELFEGTDPTTSDAPGAPTIVSPVNGIDVDTLTPTLTVANARNPRRNGLTYTFCIVVDGAAEDRCIADVASGETTTSVVFADGTALEEGTTYAWYAFASDAFSDSVFSAEGSFVVDAENAAPGSPDALSPADEARLLEGSTVSLEARAVTDEDGDSVSYVFVVANDAAFTQLVTTSAARAVPLFTIDRTLAVGTYFWRATASDGTLSTTGAGASFTIVAGVNNVAPTAPTIVSPSNETITATSATLTITAGTDADGDTLTYEFELADNAAFANAQTRTAQAGLTFAVSALREDRTSFWRARAFDGALYSDWSTASFEVNATNGAPAGLAILSPTDGALLATTPTTFVVQNAIDAEDDALTYTFTIASDAAFTTVVATGTGVVDVATTSFTLADASVITAGTPYFWRVVATDGEGTTTAKAGFTVFKAGSDPGVTPAGGGCGCSSSSEADVVGFALFGLVAMIGRRRRR